MRMIVYCFATIVLLYQNISAQDNFVAYEPDEISVKSPNSNTVFDKENLKKDISLGKRWLSQRTTNVSNTNPEWIQYSYEKETVIDSLYMFSANTDIRATDPKNFKVQAKNDGTTWELLYTSDATSKFTAKQQQKKFFLNNKKAFKHYRIVIEETKDTNQKNVSLSRVLLKGKYVPVEKDLKLEMFQIKVSEGNATLIVVKNKKYGTIYTSTLVDAGKTKADGTLIAEVIKQKSNSVLNNAFVTHYDLDHYGGMINNGGLLDLRCKQDNSFSSSIVPENPTDTSNQLNLYAVTNDGTNNPIPNTLKTKTDTYTDANTLVLQNWSPNTDIDLDPTGNIKLVSLAANAVLRNGLARPLGNKEKNNRSGAMLIVWGDYTFFIQGDMEGAGASHKIGRTDKEYRPTISNTLRRIPKSWDTPTGTSSGDAQLARNLPKNATDLKLGIRRFNLPASHAAGVPVPPAITDADIDAASGTRNKNKLKGLRDYKFFIAYPNEWLHSLGNLINTNNGAGGYAHACTTLVPHHGALNSNLWFDTKYALISNNATGNHGHPSPQSVEALYHTTGARDIYFNYLDNGTVYHGKTVYRKTEIENWQMNYVQSDSNLENVNFHILDASENFFKIEVEVDSTATANRKQFRINKGDTTTAVYRNCASH